MTRFSKNISDYPVKGRDSFDIRWRERDVNGAEHNRRHREENKEATLKFCLILEGRLEKANKTGVTLSPVNARMAISDALARYQAWFIQNHRSKMHTYGVINMIKTNCSRGNLIYCDQITYHEMARMVQHYANKADHGSKFVKYTQTWARPMEKLFNVRFDKTIYDYGSEGEIPAKDDPKRPGCYTTQDYRKMFAKLLEPNPAYAMPAGRGRGRTSPEAKAKVIATTFYNRRMAFLPLFLFLLRYGNRFANARRIKVNCWDSKNRMITYVLTRTNKETPKHVIVDELMATIISKCCEGKSPNEYVFTPAYTRGESMINPQWNYSQFAKTFKQIARSAGLLGTVNWMRHTAITDLVDIMGGELRLVADVTGHKKVTSLDHYVKTPQDHKRVLADKYDKEDKNSYIVASMKRMLARDLPPMRSGLLNNHMEDPDENGESAAELQ